MPSGPRGATSIISACPCSPWRREASIPSSLTSRFARLADLLIQRIFRLIDDIELTGASTILDRIFRAEKRGFGAASDIIKIRELRNIIAHEYNGDKMEEIYHVVAMLSPALLVIVARTIAYVRSRQFVSS